VSTTPARGLPPRIYVPILAIFAVAFLAVMAYFLRIGLGNTGTALGPASAPAGTAARPVPGLPGNEVGGGSGGPPAPVMEQLQAMRERLRTNPNDVTALLTLGDMYREIGKDQDATAFYRRALRADPKNEHARDGLRALGSAP
jgi:tetratricopeptide (TPR) repeat protein